MLFYFGFFVYSDSFVHTKGRVVFKLYALDVLSLKLSMDTGYFNPIYTNRITFFISKLCFVALCAECSLFFWYMQAESLSPVRGLTCQQPQGSIILIKFSKTIRSSRSLIYICWQWWIHTLSYLRQGHLVYPFRDRSTYSKSLLKNVIHSDKPINAPSSV